MFPEPGADKLEDKAAMDLVKVRRAWSAAVVMLKMPRVPTQLALDEYHHKYDSLTNFPIPVSCIWKLKPNNFQKTF